MKKVTRVRETPVTIEVDENETKILEILDRAANVVEARPNKRKHDLEFLAVMKKS